MALENFSWVFIAFAFAFAFGIKLDYYCSIYEVIPWGNIPLLDLRYECEKNATHMQISFPGQ